MEEEKQINKGAPLLLVLPKPKVYSSLKILPSLFPPEGAHHLERVEEPG